MAHKILDNLSWLENTGHQSADGYKLELGGAAVSALSFEESFAIALAGGARIVIDSPFQSLGGGSALEINPWEPAGAEDIGQIMRRRIREAFVALDGTLNIAFDNAGPDGLTLLIGSNAWKVYFPNGSSVVGLEGGGVELLPPDPARR